MDLFEPLKIDLDGAIFSGDINKWFSDQQWTDLLGRLKSQEKNKKRSALGEIVFAGFFKRFNLNFLKDPEINGKTPDYKVYWNDKKDQSHFIFETTLLNPNDFDRNRHRLPMNPLPLRPNDEVIEEDIEINSTHRILMEVVQKYTKYKDYCLQNNVPIIIGLFPDFDLGEFYFDEFQIRNSLFGEATFNFIQQELELIAQEKPTAHGTGKIGIFSIKDFEHLASVIVCYQGNPNSDPISPQISAMNSICHNPFDFDIWINPSSSLGRSNPFHIR